MARAIAANAAYPSVGHIPLRRELDDATGMGAERLIIDGKALTGSASRDGTGFSAVAPREACLAQRQRVGWSGRKYCSLTWRILRSLRWGKDSPLSVDEEQLELHDTAARTPNPTPQIGFRSIYLVCLLSARTGFSAFQWSCWPRATAQSPDASGASAASPWRIGRPHRSSSLPFGIRGCPSYGRRPSSWRTRCQNALR